MTKVLTKNDCHVLPIDWVVPTLDDVNGYAFQKRCQRVDIVMAADTRKVYMQVYNIETHMYEWKEFHHGEYKIVKSVFGITEDRDTMYVTTNLEEENKNG